MPLNPDDVGAMPHPDSPIMQATKRKQALLEQEAVRKDTKIAEGLEKNALAMDSIRESLVIIGKAFGVVKNVASVKNTKDETSTAPTKAMGVDIQPSNIEVKGTPPKNTTDKETKVETEKVAKNQLEFLQSIDANTAKMVQMLAGKKSGPRDTKDKGGLGALGVLGLLGANAIGKMVWSIVKTTFKGIAVALTKIPFLNYVGKAFALVGNALMGLTTAFANALMKVPVISWVAKSVARISATLWNVVKTFGAGLMKGIGVAVRAIPGIGWLLHGVVSVLFGGIPEAIKRWKEGGSFLDIVKGFFWGIFDVGTLGFGPFLVEVINNRVIQPLKKIFISAKDQFEPLINGFREYIIDPFWNLINSIKKMFGRIGEWLGWSSPEVALPQPQSPKVVGKPNQIMTDDAVPITIDLTQKDSPKRFNMITNDDGVEMAIPVPSVSTDLSLLEKKPSIWGDMATGKLWDTDETTTSIMKSMKSQNIGNELPVSAYLTKPFPGVDKSHMADVFDQLQSIHNPPPKVASTNVVAPTTNATSVNNNSFSGAKQGTRNVENSYNFDVLSGNFNL